jgi:murein DD-endopeptidase MepM/ murein hydrolase activator NlpD
VASEKITLIVMHSPKSPPKSFVISRNRVILLVGLCVAFLGFSIFSGFHTFTDAISDARLSQLEGENEILRDEIARLGGKVSEFEHEMARHVEFEERIRTLADLEPMDDDVWKVGIGGPETGASAQASHPSGEELTSLNQDVDRLLRQMKLQRHSFDEILQRLRDKAEELSFVPSIRPVDGGYISSGFGRRRDPFSGRFSRHEGADFCARRGSKIYATADGVVDLAKYERGYGYTVEIDHGNGIVTRYAHNAKLLVKKGKKIERGDVIAYLGDSGRSTAPHLHYEVRVNGVPQNPLKFILPSDVVVD